MYQTFIGLEVHIHLSTTTKVFCACRAAFGDEPNTNVCPVCMGHPGVLPSLNAEALIMGTVVARALNCVIPERTWFERKQYFYPDMPKNYQISQFASPLGVAGHMDLELLGGTKRIRIKECHLEEDAGKMIHAGNASLLDYNRAGTALLEIVTEPDLESGEEAEFFIQQLRRTVRYLGVCDGNMEEGSLRADANVSLNLVGAGLGRKVEIKNLNSSRFVRLGLDYERIRQAAVLDSGGTVTQETRLWNENRDQTESMRTKEEAHDYRYFPEPDLPVFQPDAAFLAAVDSSLVELPVPRAKRLAAEYDLSAAQAAYVCEERAMADYFEAAVEAAAARGLERRDAAARAAAWVASDLKRIMNRDGLDAASMDSFVFTPERFAQLLVLVAAGRLSGKNAKQTLELSVSGNLDPEEAVRLRGWEQITDPALLAAAVSEVMEKEAAAYREASDAAAAGDGKRRETLTAYLVGKVLSATDGRAEPNLVKGRIAALLSPKS